MRARSEAKPDLPDNDPFCDTWRCACAGSSLVSVGTARFSTTAGYIAGIAVLAADLARPETASMPFFDSMR